MIFSLKSHKGTESFFRLFLKILLWGVDPFRIYIHKLAKRKKKILQLEKNKKKNNIFIIDTKNYQKVLKKLRVKKKESKRKPV